MSSGSSFLQAYRDDFSVNVSNAQFAKQQTSGLSLGGLSNYLNLKPLQLPYVTAARVVIVYNVTATAAVAPNAGTDTLDVVAGNGGQVMVFPGPNTAFRSQLLTRKAIESVEKFAFDVNFGYPRGPLPTFAAAGSNTVTASFYLPVGGEAASLRFILPAAPSNLYATPADVSFSPVSITVYPVEGNNDMIWAYKESTTPSLGTGLQTIQEYIPADIQPDVIFEMGESSSTISSVFAVGLNNVQLYNTTDVTSITQGATALTPRTGADPFALDLPAMGVGFLTLQETFVAATTHDLVYLQTSGSQVMNPGQSPAPTVSEATSGAPPAVKMQGTVNQAGAVQAAPSKGRGAPAAGPGISYHAPVNTFLRGRGGGRTPVGRRTA